MIFEGLRGGCAAARLFLLGIKTRLTGSKLKESGGRGGGVRLSSNGITLITHQVAHTAITDDKSIHRASFNRLIKKSVYFKGLASPR